MTHAITFIAPYKKLAELFEETCRDLDKNMSYKIGDLEEGARQAVKLEEQGTDVIISRGGTALAIRKQVTDVPVVEVTVSGFDLIRVLHEARHETNRIAVVGFYPFTHGIKDLENILDIKLTVITLEEQWYDKVDIIEEKLEEIKEKKINCIVGDNISVKIAKQLGLNALLVRSGKEALSQAIFEAERVAKVRRQEKERTKRIQSIIDFAYEGIISINNNGIIDTFNQKAEEIFDKDSYKVIGKKIDKILPDLDLMEAVKTGQREQGKVWTVDNKKIMANIIPIKIHDEVVRVMATFHKSSQIQRMEQRVREELYLKGHTADNTFEDIIGEGEVITKVKEEARDYARVDLPLLLFGETGTGKELFAQAIHNTSLRQQKPFVAFNCAALPLNLLESELFGYVKGAFTGAQKEGKAGLFEQAHEGTIFLDEIGEIPNEIQTRLLRVIEERKIRRLGDDKLTPVNVRIIAATNKGLYKMVEDGKFRSDLYYRINVLNLNMPPLRERREDIPLLVDFFIEKARHKINKVVKGISEEGMKILQSYHWPGNVRQLENIIERLTVRAKEEYILTNLVREVMNSLEGNIREKADYSLKTEISSDNTLEVSLDEKLEQIEYFVIKKVLEEENGNKSAAAERLGIGRTTLWRKLKK